MRRSPTDRRRLAAAASVAIMLLTLSGCITHEPDPSFPGGEAVPVVLPLSDETRESKYEEFVQLEIERLQGMHPHVAVPDTTRIRFVEPGEWASALAECLRSEGFEATVHQDGGIRLGPIPREQNEAQALAYFSCAVSYPVDPRYSVPLNESQLAYLYRYYVQRLVPCLEAEGYAISNPPTWQRFLETYGATSPWSPYSDVLENVEQRWIVINELCPQHPEGLYGE